MDQWRHPLPVDDARRLGRITEGQQGVVIAAMPLSKGLRRDVGIEGSDVPWTDAEDVSHQKRVS